MRARAQLAVDVVAVRLGDVARQRLGEVERRRRHPERLEDLRPHRLVVRGAAAPCPDTAIEPPMKPAAAAIRLLYWKTSPNLLVGCIVPSSSSADAGVSLRVLEQPLEVLPRHAGARADEVLHEHLLRRRGVAELERWVELRDRLVPAQLLLVDELGEQERRQRLRVRRGDEQRVRVDRVGLAQLLHAEAARPDDLPAVDEGEARRRACRASSSPPATNSFSVASLFASSGCAFLPANDSRA